MTSNSRASSLLCLLLALFIVAPLSSQQREGEVEAFLGGIARTLYGFAWPTATYKGFRLDDTRPNPNGGLDIVFVIHGLSAFSGDSLWTEVVLTVKNWDITDLRWGRNNAILAQPGETVAAIGQMLEELNREADRPAVKPAILAQSWTLVDGCNDGAGVHFRIFDMTGGKTNLVWPNLEERYVLPRGETRMVQLHVAPGSKLCYGAASDRPGSGTYWGVGVNGAESCESCCYSADVPAISFTLTCG